MPTNKDLFDKLDSGVTKPAYILHYRPKATDEICYSYTSTIFKDENKFWLFVNKLLNWGWEYTYQEIQIPATTARKAYKIKEQNARDYTS